MIRIRPVAEADLPIIRTWMRDAPQAPAWSDDDLAAIVKAPSGDQRRIRRGWIAEDESTSSMAGFVVATALCVPGTAAECDLEYLFVAPEARRRGTARTLIGVVFVWARDLGAEGIRLEVRASNAPALRLYQRSGFLIVGNRPAYYVDPREDAVLMHCRIDRGPEEAPV